MMGQFLVFQFQQGVYNKNLVRSTPLIILTFYVNFILSFTNATLVALNVFPLKLKLLKKRPFTENVTLFFPVTFKILASKETYLDFDSDIGTLGLVNDTMGFWAFIRLINYNSFIICSSLIICSNYFNIVFPIFQANIICLKLISIK